MSGLGTTVAAFLGIGGLTAYLAGVVGLRDTRRLLSAGVRTSALVRVRPEATRPLLQFTTQDDQGRVMEVYGPAGLVDGSQVWLRYDPADPREVVVEGREGQGREYAFILLGVLAVLAALVLLAA